MNNQFIKHSANKSKLRRISLRSLTVRKERTFGQKTLDEQSEYRSYFEITLPMAHCIVRVKAFDYIR